MANRTLFITGGAGFIGANLAAHYLQLGDTVTLYDDLSRQGVTHNLNWLKAISPSRVRLIKADVTDFKHLKSALKDHDVIFHCAGQTAVTTSITDPRRDFAVNATGTLNLLEAVRQVAPKAPIVYTSTNKVYGSLPGLTLKPLKTRYQPLGKKSVDESAPLDFHSPYGCSKGAADQYVRDYARIFNLNTIVFRQSCIYGTHQYGVEDQGWVAHFTARAIQNQPVTIFGNGKQVRDLLYIDDLIQAFDLAVKHLSRTRGQIYNIGGGIHHQSSLIELISRLSDLSGRPIKPIFKPARLGDQPYYVSDITKAAKDFGWRPTHSLDQGLPKLYYWLADHLKGNHHAA